MSSISDRITKIMQSAKEFEKRKKHFGEICKSIEKFINGNENFGVSLKSVEDHQLLLVFLGVDYRLRLSSDPKLNFALVEFERIDCDVNEFKTINPVSFLKIDETGNIGLGALFEDAGFVTYIGDPNLPTIVMAEFLSQAIVDF